MENNDIEFIIENVEDYRYWKSKLNVLVRDGMAREVAKYTLSLFDGRDVAFVETEGGDEFATLWNDIKENIDDKDKVLAFMAIILCNKKNIKSYFSLFPDSAMKVMRRMFHNFYVARDDVEQMVTPPVTDKSLLNECGVGECSWFYCSYYPAFKNSGKDSGMRTYLYFPPSVFLTLLPVFREETERPLLVLDKLPKGSELRISSFEKDILVDVNVIKNLYIKGDYTTRPSKLVPAQIKKDLQIQALKEFDLSPLMEDVTFMRTQFVVSGMAMMMLAYPQMVKSENTMEQDFIKAMVGKVQYHRELTFDMFLPYVSGIKKSDIENCSSNRLLTRVMHYIQLFGDKWISVESLDGLLYKTTNDVKTPLTLINPQGVSDRHYIFNKFTMVAVNADKLVGQLGLAFVHSYIMYLASLGCVEVAYDDVDRKADSPYEGLRYFRLTALGKYAFDITKEYNPPQITLEKDYFEIDESRLIVRSLVEENPYVHLVADVANSFFGGRYEITAQSFLAHCTSEKDLEYKIAVFKQYVCSELPQIWIDFFEQIKKRCKPLKACAPQNFKIYQVANENKEVIRLLTNDAKLRSYILRCEDYYIMVKMECNQLFEERMKELGYLL